MLKCSYRCGWGDSMYRVKMYNPAEKRFHYLRLFIGLGEALDYADELVQDSLPDMIIGIFDHDDQMMFSIRFDESNLRTLRSKSSFGANAAVGD